MDHQEETLIVGFMAAIICAGFAAHGPMADDAERQAVETAKRIIGCIREDVRAEVVG